MKKILIIGDDVHTIRYIESLIFNENLILLLKDIGNDSRMISKKYNVPLYNKNIIDGCFDYVLYTMPNKFSKKDSEELKSFKGLLLLEKPLLDLSLIECLNCQKYIIHLRKFEANKGKKELKQENYISWPNLLNDGMNPLYNTFVNIIDYLDTIIENPNYELQTYKNADTNMEVILKTNNKNIFINIYNTNDLSLQPTINDETIEWPNYFNCINNLFQCIDQEKIDFESLMNREKKLNKLLKEME